MYNKQLIIGYLGRDPEMRFTPSGQAVCSFTVATTKTWTDKNSGERVKRTIWNRVSVWGNMAEKCNKYLAKGSLVFVDGEPVADENGNPRIWTKSDGSAGASFEITASNVIFLSKNEKTGETAQVSVNDAIDEDIPF